jgi:hypothetical protein
MQRAFLPAVPLPAVMAGTYPHRPPSVPRRLAPGKKGVACSGRAPCSPRSMAGGGAGPSSAQTCSQFCALRPSLERPRSRTLWCSGSPEGDRAHGAGGWSGCSPLRSGPRGSSARTGPQEGHALAAGGSLSPAARAALPRPAARALERRGQQAPTHGHTRSPGAGITSHDPHGTAPSISPPHRAGAAPASCRPPPAVPGPSRSAPPPAAPGPSILYLLGRLGGRHPTPTSPLCALPPPLRPPERRTRSLAGGLRRACVRAASRAPV